ncbi:hypothetical protein B4064_0704 [Caldibacillus thermoamylovorans]|nr:hypothetical protein B4065_0753 [Caldibacillus thermoamylovorans]KIO61764.1 hypothetical protein B4064_0704 [Caldibacillus thermoamylovorans]
MDAIFKASFFSIIFYFYYIPENDFYNSICLFLLKISHIFLHGRQDLAIVLSV